MLLNSRIIIKPLKLVAKISRHRFSNNTHLNTQIRTFLSPAYYCQEAWQSRLNSPLLQKVNLNELYHELDQRFQRTRQISAVDVDIFANAITDDMFIDELLDLVHKLRLSAETGNMLKSTTHAVIRALLDHGKSTAAGGGVELVNVLDDRLNYGLFLDDYTANILLDTFWKRKDYVQGARVASQLMLQEDFSHPLSTAFSLMHCYKYLLDPAAEATWPKPPTPDEPEEEVKIRVNFLRNPYDDQHFDLREPHLIVGKTLMMATTDTGNQDDILDRSLHLLGLVLFNQNDEAKRKFDGKQIYEGIISLFPESSDNIKQELKECLDEEPGDVESLLANRVKETLNKTCEHDIARQCNQFVEWENERMTALKQQQQRLDTAKRLKEIDEIKRSLQDRETKLWFFENEEQIELEIEEKLKVDVHQHERKVKTSGKEVDLEYIPPDVDARQN